MTADVTVIGAGYGGLTAAAILAAKGLDVLVLEASGHIGGRAASDRKGGFLVDYGIHANRYAGQGAAAAALREIDHEIEFASMGEPLLYRDSGFVPLPGGVPEFLKAGFLSSGDKAIMISDMLRLVVGRTRKKDDIPLEKAVWGTGRKEIGSMFKLLSGIGLVSPDISLTSAGDFATFLKRALKAEETVGFPRRGTSQIIEALSSKIEQSGKILTRSRVKSLVVKAGKVTAVRVKEEEYSGKAFILATPLQKLPKMVEGVLPEEYMKRCASIVPTAGISIDLCLKGKVSDIDGLVVTPEPVTMGQFTSNIDPETAPKGKQLVTWYYPLPVEVMDNRTAVEKEERRFKTLIDGIFPGIIEKTEWERVLRLKMVDGFEPRVGQTAKDRPGTMVPGVENLFLAGDVVSAPGSGGDVAFASGSNAAREIISFLS